jgi:hypothetical protein
MSELPITKQAGMRAWVDTLASKSKMAGEEAAMLGKRSNLIKGAGTVAASAIIGAGASNLLSEKMKKKKGVKETTQAAATIGSMFFIQSGFHHALAAPKTSKRVLQSLTRAAHEVYPAAKKAFGAFKRIK